MARNFFVHRLITAPTDFQLSLALGGVATRLKPPRDISLAVLFQEPSTQKCIDGCHATVPAELSYPTITVQCPSLGIWYELKK